MGSSDGERDKKLHAYPFDIFQDLNSAYWKVAITTSENMKIRVPKTQYTDGTYR